MVLSDKIKGLKRRISQVNQAIKEEIYIFNKNNVCKKCIKTIGNKESPSTNFQLNLHLKINKKNIPLKIPNQQLPNIIFLLKLSI